MFGSFSWFKPRWKHIGLCNEASDGENTFSLQALLSPSQVQDHSTAEGPAMRAIRERMAKTEPRLLSCLVLGSGIVSRGADGRILFRKGSFIQASPAKFGDNAELRC